MNLGFHFILRCPATKRDRRERRTAHFVHIDSNTIPEIALFDICYSILLLIYLMLQTSIFRLKESTSHRLRVKKFPAYRFIYFSILTPISFLILFPCYVHIKCNPITFTRYVSVRSWFLFNNKICYFYSISYFFFCFVVSIFVFDVLKCIDTQRYRRRCDAVGLDDNAPSCAKRVVDAATAAAAEAANATNGPTKENDRRLKKHVDKCRTKTGMDVYYYIMAYCVAFVWCMHVCCLLLLLCARKYQFKDSMLIFITVEFRTREREKDDKCYVWKSHFIL